MPVQKLQIIWLDIDWDTSIRYSI